MSELLSSAVTGLLAAIVAWLVADWRCRHWRGLAGTLLDNSNRLLETAATWRDAAEGWKAAATEWRSLAKERRP